LPGSGKVYLPITWDVVSDNGVMKVEQESELELKPPTGGHFKRKKRMLDFGRRRECCTLVEDFKVKRAVWQKGERAPSWPVVRRGNFGRQKVHGDGGDRYISTYRKFLVTAKIQFGKI